MNYSQSYFKYVTKNHKLCVAELKLPSYCYKIKNPGCIRLSCAEVIKITCGDEEIPEAKSLYVTEKNRLIYKTGHIVYPHVRPTFHNHAGIFAYDTPEKLID